MTNTAPASAEPARLAPAWRACLYYVAGGAALKISVSVTTALLVYLLRAPVTTRGGLQVQSASGHIDPFEVVGALIFAPIFEAIPVIIAVWLGRKVRYGVLAAAGVMLILMTFAHGGGYVGGAAGVMFAALTLWSAREWHVRGEDMALAVAILSHFGANLVTVVAWII